MTPRTTNNDDDDDARLIAIAIALRRRCVACVAMRYDAVFLREN